jgi:hypothetical protein
VRPICVYYMNVEIVSFFFRLFAVNCIYVQGVLFESVKGANKNISSFSTLWTDFEQRVLPSTALAATNMTVPHVLKVRTLIVDSGLKEQLRNLESIISANPHPNFSSIQKALQMLRFDLIEMDAQKFNPANVSGTNIFGNMSIEFKKQRHFVDGLTLFSKKFTNAVMWIDPWVASSWPWLLVIMLSFFQFQSVIIRSISIFSAIISAATILQLAFAFLSCILFAVTVIINDACSLLPAKDASYWKIITESSFFWNRFGTGCLSEQNRNMFAAFGAHRTASCDSLLNISQYSNDVFDVMIACKNILDANVTSVLTAFQTMNPSLAVKFSAIRNEINRLSPPISMQWPKIFENMLQTHGDCALLLQRCTLHVFVSNVLFTSAQNRIL